MKEKNEQELGTNRLSVKPAKIASDCLTTFICILTVLIGGFTWTVFMTFKNEMNSLGAEGITSVTTKPGPGLSTPPLVVHFVESFAFC